MSNATYIGIDPGADGCVAVLRNGKLQHCLCLRKVTDKDVSDLLNEVWQEYTMHNRGKDDLFAVIEKLQPRPWSQSSSIAMFKLGNSFGFLRVA